MTTRILINNLNNRINHLQSEINNLIEGGMSNPSDEDLIMLNKGITGLSYIAGNSTSPIVVNSTLNMSGNSITNVNEINGIVYPPPDAGWVSTALSDLNMSSFDINSVSNVRGNPTTKILDIQDVVPYAYPDTTNLHPNSDIQLNDDTIYLATYTRGGLPSVSDYTIDNGGHQLGISYSTQNILHKLTYTTNGNLQIISTENGTPIPDRGSITNPYGLTNSGSFQVFNADNINKTGLDLTNTTIINATSITGSTVNNSLILQNIGTNPTTTATIADKAFNVVINNPDTNNVYNMTYNGETLNFQNFDNSDPNNPVEFGSFITGVDTLTVNQIVIPSNGGGIGATEAINLNGNKIINVDFKNIYDTSPTAGSAVQVLSSDSNGNLSWVNNWVSSAVSDLNLDNYSIKNATMTNPFIQNPIVSGYVLSSDTSGNLSWVVKDGPSSFVPIADQDLNMSNFRILNVDFKNIFNSNPTAVAQVLGCDTGGNLSWVNNWVSSARSDLNLDYYKISNALMKNPFDTQPTQNGYVLSSDTSGNLSWVVKDGPSSFVPIADQDLNMSNFRILNVDFKNIFNSNPTAVAQVLGCDTAGNLSWVNNWVSSARSDLNLDYYKITNALMKNPFDTQPTVNGQVLSSDTTGNLSWIIPPSNSFVPIADQDLNMNSHNINAGTNNDLTISAGVLNNLVVGTQTGERKNITTYSSSYNDTTDVYTSSIVSKATSADNGVNFGSLDLSNIFDIGVETGITTLTLKNVFNSVEDNNATFTAPNIIATNSLETGTLVTTGTINAGGNLITNGHNIYAGSNNNLTISCEDYNTLTIGAISTGGIITINSLTSYYGYDDISTNTKVNIMNSLLTTQDNFFSTLEFKGTLDTVSQQNSTTLTLKNVSNSVENNNATFIAPNVVASSSLQTGTIYAGAGQNMIIKSDNTKGLVIGTTDTNLDGINAITSYSGVSDVLGAFTNTINSRVGYDAGAYGSLQLQNVNDPNGVSSTTLTLKNVSGSVENTNATFTAPTIVASNSLETGTIVTTGTITAGGDLTMNFNKIKEIDILLGDNENHASLLIAGCEPYAYPNTANLYPNNQIALTQADGIYITDYSRQSGNNEHEDTLIIGNGGLNFTKNAGSQNLINLLKYDTTGDLSLENRLSGVPVAGTGNINNLQGTTTSKKFVVSNPAGTTGLTGLDLNNTQIVDVAFKNIFSTAPSVNGQVLSGNTDGTLSWATGGWNGNAETDLNLGGYNIVAGQNNMRVSVPVNFGMLVGSFDDSFNQSALTSYNTSTTGGLFTNTMNSSVSSTSSVYGSLQLQNQFQVGTNSSSTTLTLKNVFGNAEDTSATFTAPNIIATNQSTTKKLVVNNTSGSTGIDMANTIIQGCGMKNPFVTAPSVNGQILTGNTDGTLIWATGGGGGGWVGTATSDLDMQTYHINTSLIRGKESETAGSYSLNISDGTAGFAGVYNEINMLNDGTSPEVRIVQKSNSGSILTGMVVSGGINILHGGVVIANGGLTVGQGNLIISNNQSLILNGTTITNTNSQQYNGSLVLPMSPVGYPDVTTNDQVILYKAPYNVFSGMFFIGGKSAVFTNNGSTVSAGVRLSWTSSYVNVGLNSATNFRGTTIFYFNSGKESVGTIRIDTSGFTSWLVTFECLLVDPLHNGDTILFGDDVSTFSYIPQ